MKHLYFYILFLVSSNFLMSQTVERIEIKGVVVASNEDVEGIVIFNTSSNKGIVTNKNGEFVITVTENDILEILALQFKTVSITISSDIIKTKFLKIYVSEQINQLDAILLTSGLSGVLASDISKTKERPTIELNLGNMNAMEFFDEKAFDNQVISDALNAVVNKGMLYNGANFGAIFGLLLKAKKKKTKHTEVFDAGKTISLIDIYTSEGLSETFNIPLEQVGAFIVFVEDNGLNSELLKKENEFMLIEFLVRQSELFLNNLHAKN